MKRIIALSFLLILGMNLSCNRDVTNGDKEKIHTQGEYDQTDLNSGNGMGPSNLDSKPDQ
jgi:hypothetical protein